ncbi:hypothetical protein BH11PAT2_BH11PAT2_02240 [soil metagenome]
MIIHAPRSHPRQSRQGFALVISLIFVSVVLALGVSLLDVAYKQILLSSGSKQSQAAFYNADSALECALYWDQKSNAFSFISSGVPLSSIVCDSRTVSSSTSNVSGNTRVTTFNTSCATSGTSALITIYKQSTGTTDIYSNGYNNCDASSATRIERGLKVHY